MKNSWIIIASLLGLLVACNKIEVQIEAPEDEPVVVTYIKADGNEDATKASVSDSDASFTWNTGDKIAVYAGGYKISDDLESTYNAATNATFAFSGDNAVTEANRANFAIFPASLVWDGTSIRSGSVSDYTSSSLKLTLPASYTLAQVQGEVSPTPMIATNAPDGDLAFKALCPLLRVTVVNIPKQTKRIEFDFNGKKVQGEFTLTDVDPGTTAIATSETDGADDIITVTMVDNTTWHDNLVINLPVPTGTYGNITITAYDATSGGHAVLTLTKPIKSTGWTPTRKSSRKMTATLPVFSVGADTKVVFAPGNLQAVFAEAGSSCTWQFATNQYDYIGGRSYGGSEEETGNNFINGSGSVSAAGTVDLFGWNGTNATNDNYGIHNSTSEADYGNNASDNLKSDWGNNAIGSYVANTWRTLTGGSGGEWEYLFNTRSASTVNETGNARFAKAYLFSTTHGIILFPDEYSHPDGVTAPTGINKTDNTSWNANTYSAEDWTKMEAHGAVFLPAAGFRSGTVVYDVGSDGGYWSSTAGNAYYAYRLYFSSSLVYPAFSTSRCFGFSVRLVQNLN